MKNKIEYFMDAFGEVIKELKCQASIIDSLSNEYTKVFHENEELKKENAKLKEKLEKINKMEETK